MTDSSEIGRYGTLRLLKRHEPETTVAFFPVDDETVTFGRSKQCSVRLYYDCVSELHCTLQISEERKAFLLVQGTNGLLVDGCQVGPSGSPGAGPTTVPLTNGSEIEIYKKRFKFEYPPKEIRAALLATPRNSKSRRSLRMSMIRSAQVFTPRPSPQDLPRTPRRGSIRDNIQWEALRSPVTVPCYDSGLQENMMLLEGYGDDAIVVEEEKDIIILQQVENDSLDELAPGPAKARTRPGRSVAFSIPPATPPPKHTVVPQSARPTQHAPQTPPANRRRSAPSLHRAVVLRSAQRALERAREKFEEEQEEDEVEAVVSPERELGPLETYSDEEEEDEGIDDADEDQEEDPQPQPSVIPSNVPALPPGRRMSVFRASLDAMRKVIPLSVPFGWKAPEEIPLPEDDPEEDGDEEELDQDDNEHPDQDGTDEDLDSHAEVRTPVRRNLGPFMTPQVQFNKPAQRVPVDPKARASIGGEGVAQRAFGGAQRVRVVPAWKVKDIVLPEPDKQKRIEGKQEPKKERISEEERQAIMERRKSALLTPSSLPMPGPRSSAFPPPQRTDLYTPGEDSDEDAETMLEKMRQKMANVRRRSEARRVRMSVGGRQQGEEFSLLAAGAERSDRGLLDAGITEETLSQMKRMELSDNDDELPPEATGAKFAQDSDDLNLLDASTDENTRRATTRVGSGPSNSSLTPRFDGVREMFRQPRMDPKTPSFTGFRKMFQERSEVPPKTPSLRGVREMFNRHGTAQIPATPHMDLGDMFDDEEDDESAGMAVDSGDMGQNTNVDDITDDQDSPPPTRRPTTTPAVKSEDENPVVSTVAPKTAMRTRKAAVSATKRSSRKKDVPVIEVPSAVAEEQASEEEEDEEVEPTPPPGARRSTKRAVKMTITPITEEATASGQGTGRGTSRSTKKGATVAAQSTSKGIVVHKTTRARRVADIDSEEELPTNSGRTAKGTGRAKRVANNQASENEADQEQGDEQVSAKAKSGPRKAKAAVTSDSDGVAAPKARRGRTVKTPQLQVDVDEDASAPTTTKTTRRIKTEDTPESESLPPAAKAPKPRRGARTKAIMDDENTSPARLDGQLSEIEDITPAPSKGKVTKAGARKKTPGSKDGMIEDKENSGDPLPKSSGKTPAVRTRKTPVATPVEALDAPAKRTRSRK